MGHRVSRRIADRSTPASAKRASRRVLRPIVAGIAAAVLAIAVPPPAFAAQPLSQSATEISIDCTGSLHDYPVSVEITYSPSWGWFFADLSPTLFVSTDASALDGVSTSAVTGSVPVRTYEDDGSTVVGTLHVSLTGGPMGEPVSGDVRTGENNPPLHGNLRYRYQWTRQPLAFSGTAALGDDTIFLDCNGAYEQSTFWVTQPSATVVIDTRKTVAITCVFGENPETDPLLRIRENWAMLLMPDGSAYFDWMPEWVTPRRVEGTLSPDAASPGDPGVPLPYRADLQATGGEQILSYDPYDGVLSGQRLIHYSVSGTFALPDGRVVDLSACNGREYGPYHGIWVPFGP